MTVAWDLPGYAVEELVGFGRTGEVWRARRRADDCVVALKRLRRAPADGGARLRHEATVLSEVAGPHVVRLHDVVETGDGQVVLVLDYAAGGSLATVLAVRGRLAAPEVVTLLAPLAQALQEVHDRGLHHGAISPANIVFSADGRPMLADVGLRGEATPGYVDPAVARGGAPGAPADVFGLAAVGYVALAGRPPWDADDADAAFAQARDGGRPPLAALAPGAPPALVAAVEGGLADDPALRYTAAELAAGVLRACAAAPVGLVRTSAPALQRPAGPTTAVPGQPTAPAGDARVPPGEPRRPSGRLVRRAAAVAAAGGLLVAAVMVGVGLGRRSGTEAATLPASSPPPAAPVSLAVPRAPTPPWPSVVASLEQARARAFALARPALLQRVYRPGSPQLAADAAAVRRLRAGHRRIVGFHPQVLAVRQVRRSAGAVVLGVRDALSAYTVVDAAGRPVAAGPARAASWFRVRLVSTARGWRVASWTAAR